MSGHFAAPTGSRQVATESPAYADFRPWNGAAERTTLGGARHHARCGPGLTPGALRRRRAGSCSYTEEETPLDGYRTAALAVVVGVDGSDIALRALRWATDEAQRRGAPLRIVHVTPYAERGVASERRAESILTSARTTAEQTWPDAEISTACVAGHAAPALAEAAADAQLLVVAMGGGERYEDIRLHSTALSLCTAAKCPVAVVRGVAEVVPDDGPVVLGVESVDADAVAVTVAFADAQRHGTGLIVVHAVRGTGLLRDHLIGYDVHSRRGAEALTAVTEELAPWRSRYPEVPVEIRRRRPARSGASAAGRHDRPPRRGRYPGAEPRHASRARVGQPHRRAERALPRGRGAPRHAAGRVGPVRRRTCAREAGGPSPEPWALHRHDRQQRW